MKALQVGKLERMLARTLVPVAPRPVFVKGLRMQLRSTISAPTGFKRRVEAQKITLLSLAGLISLLLLVATGFRTTATILGIIGLFSELNRRVGSKRTKRVPAI